MNKKYFAQIIATDNDGLQMISACTAGAKVTVADIKYLAFNKVFLSDIKKIEPFGTGNPNPTFLFKDLKAIKTTTLKNKHVSVVLKSKVGFSIKAISFNSVNNKVGEYLLNYKKTFNVLGQINENIWNDKKVLQLTIQDLII